MAVLRIDNFAGEIPRMPIRSPPGGAARYAEVASQVNQILDIEEARHIQKN